MYTCPRCYGLPIKGDGFVIVCSVCNGTGGGEAYDTPEVVEITLVVSIKVEIVEVRKIQ